MGSFHHNAAPPPDNDSSPTPSALTLPSVNIAAHADLAPGCLTSDVPSAHVIGSAHILPDVSAGIAALADLGPGCVASDVPPSHVAANLSTDHILPDVSAAIAAHTDLGSFGCASDALSAHVAGNFSTDHILPDVSAGIAAHGDVLSAQVDGNAGNEYPCDHSAAIAANADLGLELGSCGHSTAPDLVTANVDAHLGDLAHDQLHVNVG
jgi:hypothetical protein